MLNFIGREKKYLVRKKKEDVSSHENKERMKKYHARPEVKQNQKSYMKKYQSIPENMEKKRAYEREYSKRPEVMEKRKAKAKIYSKKYHARPEVKKRITEYQSRPERRLKVKEYQSRPEIKQRLIKRAKDVKLEVFNHYSKEVSNSNTPICACCGYSDIRFLSLDHIKSRKNVSKEEKEITGERLWKYVRDNGFQKGYQILCHNCNIAKGDRKYCPHQLDKMKK